MNRKGVQQFIGEDYSGRYTLKCLKLPELHVGTKPGQTITSTRARISTDFIDDVFGSNKDFRRTQPEHGSVTRTRMTSELMKRGLIIRTVRMPGNLELPDSPGKTLQAPAHGDIP